MSDLGSRRRGGLHIAFRLARRNALAAPGRSLLVIALVALPVVGLAGLATVVTSKVPTVKETIRNQLGHTQAMIQMVSPPDPTLVQSPNDPGYNQVEYDSKGPVHHKDGDPLVAPATFLPGERILSIRATSVTLKTAHGTGSLSAIEGQPWDASFAGKFDRQSGRVPVAANEVMASPAALKRLGVAVGDTVAVLLPKPSTVTIVGTLADRGQPSNVQALYSLPAALDGVTPAADLADTEFFLPDTRVTWGKVRALNRSGAVVLSRDVLLNPPPASDVTIPVQADYIPWSQLTLAFPLAGFAIFEVALLAGAAFAVGARRQQRSLATLASVGGDRRMLFQVIAFGGIVLGILGGVIGSAIGVLGAWTFIRLTSDGSATEYPGFHPNLVVLSAIVLFAAFAGLLAAAIPARAASRIDVATALRGALRPPRVSARRPVIGVVLVAAGGAVAIAGGIVTLLPQKPGEYNPTPVSIGLSLVVIGPIVMQVGAVLLAPLILRGVSRLLAGVGLGARLGSRDASRNSGRSVPALAAIMTTIFVGSFVMTFASSLEAQERATWSYWTAPNVAMADLRGWEPNGHAPTEADAAKAVTAIQSVFGVRGGDVLHSSVTRNGEQETAADKKSLFAAPTLIATKACPRGPFGGSENGAPQSCSRAPYEINQVIWVGTASDLSAALGEPASATSRATLAAGGAVSLYPQYVQNGRTTIGWRTGAQQDKDEQSQRLSPPVRSASLPATLQSAPHDYHFTIFISPETAARIGVVAVPSAVLTPVPGPPSDAQYDALNAAASAITGGISGQSPMYFRVEPGPPNVSGFIAWALLALCIVIALGAASVALGLARTDGRRDDYVLGATGASPRLRRSFGFWQAIVLAGTGAIIGVILGTIPVFALSLAPPELGAVVFSPPWIQLLLTAFALPLIIAIGTWLTAGGGRRSVTSREIARA
jgi:putative ABC transport system permease protein